MLQCILVVYILFCLPITSLCADPAVHTDIISNNISSSKARTNTTTQPENSLPAANPTPEAPTVDDTASFDIIANYLAGIQVPETGSYSIYTKTAAWKKYAAVADSRWVFFNKNKAAAIRKWSNIALADIRSSSRTILYPFSGPDFLYAYTFFPDADMYVLIGLESSGRFPDFSGMSEKDFSTCFQMLDETLKDILQISFFKTNDMSEELNGECISGTLPVLMLFLARTGSHITSIRFFDLDSDGLPSYRLSTSKCRGRKGFCRGMEIEFTPAKTNLKKRLVYLSADISDGGFSQCPGCKMYLEKLEGPVVTFTKSASYLMHKSYFSGIRNLILKKSTFILQDDSAIPYRYFNNKLWDITLYGTYTGPIGMFKDHFEKDLAAAYRQSTDKINFRFGYPRRSNMLLARKKSR